MLAVKTKINWFHASLLKKIKKLPKKDVSLLKKHKITEEPE